MTDASPLSKDLAKINCAESRYVRVVREFFLHVESRFKTGEYDVEKSVSALGAAEFSAFTKEQAAIEAEMAVSVEPVEKRALCLIKAIQEEEYYLCRYRRMRASLIALPRDRLADDWVKNGIDYHANYVSELRRELHILRAFGDRLAYSRKHWAFSDCIEPKTITECLAVLGFTAPVTGDQIKSRYRELMLRHHPDSNPEKTTAQSETQYINQAYAALKKLGMVSNEKEFKRAC